MSTECAACNNTGMAIIPTRSCVMSGSIVFLPGKQYISTGAVLCDRPGCNAGRRVRDCESARTDDGARQMTLSKAESHAGVRDLPKLLRDYEQWQAKDARGNVDEVHRIADFKATYPRMWAVIEREMVEINGDADDGEVPL